MALIPLGFWAASGGGGGGYWISTLGGGTSEYGNSVATDSAGNSYVFGYTDSTGAGSNDFLLAKHDPAGAVQWQRTFGGAGSDKGFSVAIDSSDNVYAFGQTLSAGAGVTDFLLAKYNSAGTIQWQRTLGGSGYDLGFSVAIDSSDNVYVLGYQDSAGAGLDDFLIAKYNSSGVIQWQRVFGGSGNEQGYSVAIDSSDNVYVLGYTSSTGAGSNDFLLAKYNSSGTIQWQRVLGGASSEIGYSVAIDSSDNVYALGQTNSTGAGDYDFLLAKYDSSGAVQWQRTLGGASEDIGNSIAIDSSDNLYVFGTGRTTNLGFRAFLLAKLPNDGSLTGTYVLDSLNIVYAASSLTGATSTLTAATSSLTDASASLTSATSTLTDASASLTSYLVEIGA